MITNLAANAVGASDQWGLTGAADKPTAVALPDNDNTSYINEATAGDRQGFTFENLPGSAVRVTTYDIITRAAVTASGPDYTVAVSGGAGFGPASTHTPTTSYQNFTDTDLQESGPASMLSVAKINALESRVTKVAGGGNAVRVTTYYAKVTWFDAPGGHSFLFDWMVPLIGMGLSVLSFSEIAEALSFMKTRPSADFEYSLIRDNLIVRPRFVFLGA